MCIVYEFPTKKEFPKELEERLNKSSKEYIDVMMETLVTLYGDEPSDEDYAEFMEIILKAYLASLEKAIEELD